MNCMLVIEICPVILEIILAGIVHDNSTCIVSLQVIVQEPVSMRIPEIEGIVVIICKIVGCGVFLRQIIINAVVVIDCSIV